MRTHPEFVSAVFPEKLGLVTANQERHENQEQSANDRFVLFLEKKALEKVVQLGILR